MNRERGKTRNASHPMWRRCYTYVTDAGRLKSCRCPSTMSP